jgi:predicted nucleic acid-binding protein
VTPPLAYDGRVYIADTSAWSRAAHPAAEKEWTVALRNRQIATCPIVKLELLYSARDGSDFDRLEALLGALRDLPITRSVTDAALAALRKLAHLQPLYHRSVKFPDLLIAAAAEDGAVGVLHYDAHYDRLTEVLDFESRWIVPPDSL